MIETHCGDRGCHLVSGSPSLDLGLPVLPGWQSALLNYADGWPDRNSSSFSDVL